MISALIALAAQISPGSIPSAPLTTKDGQKVVCKLSPGASSRIPTRVCRTKARWAEIERTNEQQWKDGIHDYSSGRAGSIANSPEGTVSSPRMNPFP